MVDSITESTLSGKNTWKCWSGSFKRVNQQVVLKPLPGCREFGVAPLRIDYTTGFSPLASVHMTQTQEFMLTVVLREYTP